MKNYDIISNSIASAFASTYITLSVILFTFCTSASSDPILAHILLNPSFHSWLMVALTPISMNCFSNFLLSVFLISIILPQYSLISFSVITLWSSIFNFFAQLAVSPQTAYSLFSHLSAFIVFFYSHRFSTNVTPFDLFAISNLFRMLFV